MQIEVLKVHGINGEGCADTITQALEALDGVREVRVSLASKHARVEFDEQTVSSDQIHAALTQAGYRAETDQASAFTRGCGGCAVCSCSA